MMPYAHPHRTTLPPRASHRVLHTLQLAACLLTPSLALAASTAEFQVIGNVVGHCRIATEDVALEYQLRDFTGVGAELPWVPFNITSAGCDEGVGTTLRISMNGASDSVDNSLFAVTGVDGVGLQIQTEDGRAVHPDGSDPAQWERGDAGKAYPYRARFMQRSAEVTAGVGTATAVVTVFVD